MVGFLDGLKVTLKTAFRRPVTGQYPEPDKRLDIAHRFMGFPALTWDSEIGEPYCTGCMVCIRDCPTQCMSAQMKDNPLNAEGKSRRRKIIDTFEINLGRCILCGICVDVCNFDAIEMSHEHELSKYERNGNRVDLEQLLEMGKEYQAEVAWTPRQPEKNSGVPIKQEATAGAASGMTKEERLAATRARAAAKRQTAETGEPSTAISSEAKPKNEMTPEERVAAARARTAAKRQAAETDGASEARPKSEMTPEERVAAARARTRARREAAEDSDNSHEDKPEENVTE